MFWERLAEKNKKIQKKFCVKAVKGVLAYHTGGGAFGVAAKRPFLSHQKRTFRTKPAPTPTRGGFHAPDHNIQHNETPTKTKKIVM